MNPSDLAATITGPAVILSLVLVGLVLTDLAAYLDGARDDAIYGHRRAPPTRRYIAAALTGPAILTLAPLAASALTGVLPAAAVSLAGLASAALVAWQVRATNKTLVTLTA